MPYKHFTSEQKNQLSVLLRTKTKKKEIAKLLRKGRIGQLSGENGNEDQE